MFTFHRAISGVLYLCSLLVVTFASTDCAGAIDDLVRIIPGTNASNAAWGGSLQTVSPSTVLVGNGLNYSDVDTPVDLIDINTGAVVQSYAEPSNYPSRDHFGSSAIQVGSSVLVGAFATDIPGTQLFDDAGVVHVYDAASGAYQRTIENPNPSVSGSFGISMATLGNLAVIGTFKDRSSNGTVYLVDPLTGSFVDRIDNPTGIRGDNFGSTVSVIDNDVLVGTRNAGTVYRFDGTTGNLLQTYPHPLGVGGLFGFSIDASDSKVVVGAFQQGSTNNQGGAVYVYDKASGTLLSTLESPSPIDYGWFGFDVTLLDDDTLVVSEQRHVQSTGPVSGVIYAYDLNTESLLAEIPDPVSHVFPQENRFGGAMAEVGGALVIGSSRGNFVADDGPLYVYQGLIPEPASSTVIVLGGVALLRRTGRQID